ncbi:MAG: hypothetical protein ISS76_17470 [Phycisphaerae bacterium]|nr:hypothetical protein [Phycisphaerae bacterium]
MKKQAILSLLVFIVAVCGCSSDYLSAQRQQAIKCAENWKTQGFNFDPNSMTCSQMRQRVQTIRKAEYWRNKGYVLDPNSLTKEEMDIKVKDIDRARYWKKRGYEFDSYKMTRYEMNREARELENTKEWERLGYYYDPNSKTVFLTESKKTKLSSLSGLHEGVSRRQVSGSSYQHAASRSRVPIASVGRGSSYTGTATDQWEVFETTSIDGWVKKVKRGTIFKTTSGNIYEVADFVILFEMEVRSDVTVLTDGQFYKLFIEGVDESLLCRKLNRGDKDLVSGPPVIEARITNEFEGLEYGNIYKLNNGQVWEQTNFYIYIYIAVMPKVTIWQNGPFYNMKVEGIDKAVTVRQLK